VVKQSQADIMVELALNQDIILLVNQENKAYINIPEGEGFDQHELRGDYVKNWLSNLHHEAKERTPNEASIKAALNVLEGKAYQSEHKIITEGSEIGSLKPNQSHAERLLQLVEQKGVTVFVDQRNEAFIHFPVDENFEIFETHNLESRRVKTWLSALLWNTDKKVPSDEAAKSAKNVLRAQAVEYGEIPLYNRVAPGQDGEINIDLGDKRWRYINITKRGWSILSQNRVPMFRRYSHQKALPIPEKGGSVHDILPFLNIKKQDEQLLVEITLISWFFPEIPRPGISVYGPQGSTKSSFLKVIRSMIDPSSTPLLVMPRDLRELVQQLDHHYCSMYDNLSGFRHETSDVLCMAVTGAGMSKRSLYTNEEDFIVEFYRCLGFNGISLAATKGDLLERLILYELEQVEEEQRFTEKAFRLEFSERQPGILGAILDTVVKAMNILPSIRLEKKPRMADFAEIGCAISQALGIIPAKFLAAYDRNLKTQSMEALSNSEIAVVLDSWMELRIHKPWSGTYSDLFSDLVQQAQAMGVNTRGRGFPRGARALSQHMNLIIPHLPVWGYRVKKTKTKKMRLVEISSSLYKPEMDPGTIDGYTQGDAPENTEPQGRPRSVTIQDRVKSIRVQVLKAQREKGDSLTLEEALDALRPLRMDSLTLEYTWKLCLEAQAVKQIRPGRFMVTEAEQ